MWIAIHAPGAARALLPAAAVILGWALLADGPLGVLRVVGLEVHRRVLVVIALGTAVLPLVSGYGGDLLVLVPCLIGAAVLLRCGLLRWPAGPAGAGPAGAGLDEPPAARPGPRRAGPTGQPAAPAGQPAAGQAGLPQDSEASRQRPNRGTAIRRVGRATGRTGTIVARQADVAVPKGARAAGRFLGRLAGPPRR